MASDRSMPDNLDALLVASIDDALIVTDVAGIVVRWNEAATRLLGWTAAEMIGRPLIERFPPEVRADIGAMMQRLTAGGEWSGEFEDWRKDGSRVWIDARVRPVTDATGAVVGLLGLSRDISARRAEAESLAAREALAREQSERLHLALQAARMGVWVLHLQTGVVEWSPEVYTVVGVETFDGRLETWRQIVHPDDREPLRQALTRAIEHDVPFATEIRVCRPDGQIRWMATLGHLRRDEAGVPVTLIGTAQDVTDLREAAERRDAAELALRESEARFRAVLDNFPAIVTLRDLEGRYMFVNRRGAELSGVAQDAWVGKRAADVLPVDAARRLDQEVEGAQESLAPTQVERTYHLPDGRQLAVLSVRFPLFLADGTPYAICGIGTDITELKRLEAEVRQSQKMDAIGRLAGGVAHDFNNLLTVINSHCELMQMEGVDGDAAEHVGTILAAGQRAARLTGQLLAFSRKAVIEPKVLDLNEAVTTAVGMLRRVITEDVRITTRLGGVPSVHIDPTYLEQILVNLVVNARDAMPSGGALQISTRSIRVTAARGTSLWDLPPGHYVELAVADNGTGMSDEVKAHLFEPFFTSKAAGKGTGLGLATVYGIVQQAGGAIRVDSTPGQGSTFWIALPAVAPSDGCAGADTARRQLSRGHETLLVVEDEDAVRRLVALGLQAHGYHVRTAGSGAEALRLAAVGGPAPDLVLTDVVMPDMGGRALVDALRQAWPAVPVLFISGYLDDEIVRKGVEAATDAFLAKPFTPTTLARKVREVLDAAPGGAATGSA